MRSAGVSEDEIDAISAAVSVSYAHAHMPDDGGSGQFPTLVC